MQGSYGFCIKLKHLAAAVNEANSNVHALEQTSQQINTSNPKNHCLAYCDEYSN
jgi:hypothetical protein